MKRRGFIKKSGIGAGGLFVGSSLFSFLASCTKMDMMNGGNMIGGYKDTVLLLPGEIVKILVPFAELKGVFVFHCHNLEHEDDGMMLQYQLT